MKKSQTYLRNTMRKARVLQGRYNALGASSYQSVRNPLAMRELVLTVLPVLPNPLAIVSVKRQTRLTIAGKTYIKNEIAREFARDAMPADAWQKKGLTVEQVMAKLESKGYIVNLGNVACGIQLARQAGHVASVPGPWTGYRPKSLYFVTE